MKTFKVRNYSCSFLNFYITFINHNHFAKTLRPVENFKNSIKLKTEIFEM